MARKHHTSGESVYDMNRDKWILAAKRDFGINLLPKEEKKIDRIESE